MNKVFIIGRLTKDPEVKYTDGGLTIAKFSLAVDRRFKKDGEQETDFINCVSFGKTAEFIEKYFHKGSKAVVEGRIQTGSYEKDGHKVFTTDIVVENIEFGDSKAAGGNNSAKEDTSFVNVPDTDMEELPFN